MVVLTWLFLYGLYISVFIIQFIFHSFFERFIYFTVVIVVFVFYGCSNTFGISWFVYVMVVLVQFIYYTVVLI